MKKVISGRQTRKTEKLIRLSAETKTPIVTKDRNSARIIMKRADYLGLNIPQPISIDTIMNNNTNDYQVSSVIIDDAEYVLDIMLRNFNVGHVDAISICNDDIGDELL